MEARALLVNHMREALNRSIENGSSPDIFQLRLEGLNLQPTARESKWEVLCENNTPLAAVSYIFQVKGRAMNEITSQVRRLAGAVKIVHERCQRARLVN